MVMSAFARPMLLALAVAHAAAVSGRASIFEVAPLRLVGDSAQPDAPITFVMANFGMVPYGSSVEGQLFYPSQSYPDGAGHTCSAGGQPLPCEWGCVALDQASPPFPATSSPHIFIFDRVPTAEDRDRVTECKHMQKAHRAQQAGAVAVVVVDTDDTPNVAVANDALWEMKHALQIPVGMIGRSEGDALKRALQSTSAGGLAAQIDFVNPIPEQEEVEVEFWHDSDDSCGSRCTRTAELLGELSSSLALTEPGTWNRLSVRPRFVFNKLDEPCTDEWFCTTRCVNNRYCSWATDPDDSSGAAAPAMRAYIEEDVRRACLWRVLAAQDGDRTGQDWWAYYEAFAAACSTEKGTFTAKCSRQALRSAGIERAGVANAWQKCNAQLGRDGEIDVVEEELAASEGGVSGRPARVLLNPTIRINGAQYRGDLATASVVKAICAAYPDHREPAFCRAAGAPDCTAGGAGTAQCARNAAMHRSRCLDTFMGFDCLCDVGYTATQNEVGEASCVDVNECVVADPCDLANNPRSACHNTQGSFRCEHNIVDQCESGADACWHGERDGAALSSCVDNLAAYRHNAASALLETVDVPLSYCDCAALPGCWRRLPGGDCEEACSEDHCDVDAKLCMPRATLRSNGVNAGTVVGVALAIAGTLLAVALALQWHRRQVERDMNAALGRYMPLEGSPDDGAPPPSSSDAPFAVANGLELREEAARAAEEGRIAAHVPQDSARGMSPGEQMNFWCVPEGGRLAAVPGEQSAEMVTFKQKIAAAEKQATSE